ncbi:MAG: S9 family peptidase [Acidimicrobiales bacterium]
MTDLFTALLETKSAHLADVDTRSGRILIRGDLTGTMQVYEVGPGGGLQPLSDLPEPVGTARYLPGAGGCVFNMDDHGNERHQLYRIDLDLARRSGPIRMQDVVAITADPRFGHHLAGISHDGRQVAYVSNKNNGVDFDLWICDLDEGEHRLLYAGTSWLQPSSGFSPDDRWISVLRPGPRPLDTDMLLVEVSSGHVLEVQPHRDQGAIVGPPAWSGDSRFFFASSVDNDFTAVLSYDLSTSSTQKVEGTGESCDAEPFTSDDGSTLLILENRDGTNVLTICDANAPDARGGTKVPFAEPGVVESHIIRGPALSADGSTVYYTLSSPRLSGDVWSYDKGSKETTRITENPAPLGRDELTSADIEETTSFDGERIQLFVYRTGSDRPPVVILIHGGPESQSTLAFMPVVQGLVASGFTVVVPNVRGSTGYGRRFASLDDTVKRLDSVRDLAAVHAWLDQAGLDQSRAALWGGSYGGYMVLAGMAFQPELWAAGVDIVGISDLVTFLENTSDYRRAHREREYGSLADDREFLEKASPLRKADDIRSPLFVIHGRNDPRVPVSEAQQLVKSLDARGVRNELLIYEDEGHGLARLHNRLDAYPRALRFLNDVMRTT